MNIKTWPLKNENKSRKRIHDRIGSHTVRRFVMKSNKSPDCVKMISSVIAKCSRVHTTWFQTLWNANPLTRHDFNRLQSAVLCTWKRAHCTIVHEEDSQTATQSFAQRGELRAKARLIPKSHFLMKINTKDFEHLSLFCIETETGEIRESGRNENFLLFLLFPFTIRVGHEYKIVSYRSVVFVLTFCPWHIDELGSGICCT